MPASTHTDMDQCNLCPKRCGVARAVKTGACLCKTVPVVARAALHFYEEPPVSGTRGSGTVFFAGCVMRCEFCQNYLISREPRGKTYTPAELADVYKYLEDLGAHNINFVTPTQWTDAIIASFGFYRPRVPVVWNTSGYELPETLDRLSEYVDVWLPDFKYSSKELASKLSKRADYPEYAFSAVAKMRSFRRDRYESGLIKEGLIVRHLVLPGYISNSFGVLDMIKQAAGTDTTLSLMSQFTPTKESASIMRKLKPLEYKAVVAHAEKLGFKDVFVQDTDSADESYIPPFDI